LWGHKHASHTAVARRFPAEVLRLLGTITLEIEEQIVEEPKKSSTTNKKNKKAPKTKKSRSKNDFAAFCAAARKNTTSGVTPLPPEIYQWQQNKKRTWDYCRTRSPPLRFTQRVRRITHKQAWGEAHVEALQQEKQQETNSVVDTAATDAPDDRKKAATPKSGTTSRPSRKSRRATEITQQWHAIQNCDPIMETWDGDDGQVATGNGDPHYVMLEPLLKWLEYGIDEKRLVDTCQDKQQVLYNGLTVVPNSALEILYALINLTDPQTALYGIPLAAVYARMIPVTTTTTTAAATAATNKKRKSSANKKGKSNDPPVMTTTWKIQMGVYMHRLLPEIFTSQSLHIVMSALDEGSYKITQPIRLPPQGPAVFQSSPYPKVDTSVLEGFDHGHDGAAAAGTTSHRRLSNSSGSGSSSDDSSVEIIDVDLEGGSRDELVLSPFSTKGLLKLLENKGCDVSRVSVLTNSYSTTQMKQK